MIEVLFLMSVVIDVFVLFEGDFMFQKYSQLRKGAQANEANARAPVPGRRTSS